jgi:hypothetical protein
VFLSSLRALVAGLALACAAGIKMRGGGQRAVT